MHKSLNILRGYLHAGIILWHLALLLQTSKLHSTTVIPPSFDELVAKAEVIFEGELTEKNSYWLGEGATRRIETTFAFRVHDVLKGDLPQAIYELRVLGGTVGETTLKVEGAPNFAFGEQVILFVIGNGTQFVPLVGIMHGHYHFKRDVLTNQDMVVKHDGRALHDVDDIRTVPDISGRLKRQKGQGTKSTSNAPMTPQDFKNRILAKKHELER